MFNLFNSRHGVINFQSDAVVLLLSALGHPALCRPCDRPLAHLPDYTTRSCPIDRFLLPKQPSGSMSAAGKRALGPPVDARRSLTNLENISICSLLRNILTP